MDLLRIDNITKAQRNKSTHCNASNLFIKGHYQQKLTLCAFNRFPNFCSSSAILEYTFSIDSFIWPSLANWDSEITGWVIGWYLVLIHDDVIKWKHFPCYWPFVRISPLTGEFPSQRLVAPSLDVYFDLRLNKRLSKQSRRPWCETPSRSLWRHIN